MFAAPRSAVQTPSSKAAMNTKQGVYYTSAHDLGRWGLRSSRGSALLAQRVLTTGATEEPQTTALCNTVWPKTLAPSPHLLAGPTHILAASFIYLFWCGSGSSKRQRDPMHSLGWGLSQADENLFERAT